MILKFKRFSLFTISGLLSAAVLVFLIELFFIESKQLNDTKPYHTALTNTECKKDNANIILTKPDNTQTISPKSQTKLRAIDEVLRTQLSTDEIEWLAENNGLLAEHQLSNINTEQLEQIIERILNLNSSPTRSYFIKVIATLDDTHKIYSANALFYSNREIDKIAAITITNALTDSSLQEELIFTFLQQNLSENSLFKLLNIIAQQDMLQHSPMITNALTELFYSRQSLELQALILIAMTPVNINDERFDDILSFIESSMLYDKKKGLYLLEQWLIQINTQLTNEQNDYITNAMNQLIDNNQNSYELKLSALMILQHLSANSQI